MKNNMLKIIKNKHVRRTDGQIDELIDNKTNGQSLQESFSSSLSCIKFPHNLNISYLEIFIIILWFTFYRYKLFNVCS